MTDSPFQLTARGDVVAIDTDGEPVTLPAVDLLALAEFIDQHRADIQKAYQGDLVVQALGTVYALMRDPQLPTVKSLTTFVDRYDTTVDIEMGTEDDLATWAARLGCDVGPGRTHPTLGQRKTARLGAIVLEGPWDHVPTSEPAPVPA